MLPSRQSKEQNNYFDKPLFMLEYHYRELGEQALRAYNLFVSLLAEGEAVIKAIVEQRDA